MAELSSPSAFPFPRGSGGFAAECGGNGGLAGDVLPARHCQREACEGSMIRWVPRRDIDCIVRYYRPAASGRRSRLASGHTTR
jgi:hypothetical protein